MSKSDSQSNSPVESTEQYFKKVLNAHGYPFQFAVIERAHNLQRIGKTPWVFESSEIPVGTTGRSTHIDFVLRDYDRPGSKSRLNLYLVAECKRVNPSKSIWCFVRNPYPMRNPTISYYPIQFDKIVSDSSNDLPIKSGLVKYWDYPTFELPFELKASKPSDPLSPLAKSPINDAAYQVLLGQQGFISNLTALSGIDNQEKLRRENVFIPVVFTTAELFVSDVNLAEADLSSGEILNDLEDLHQVEWLWYNYRRPHDLNIPLEKRVGSHTMSDKYFAEFTRSVAIVSTSGIDGFLTRNWGDFLSD